MKNGLLAIAAMAGALSNADGLGAVRPRKIEPGQRLGGRAREGEEFSDSRGQRYVRDARGTIRRVR